MELHVNDSIPEIVYFWAAVVDKILELPSKPGMVRYAIVLTLLSSICFPLLSLSLSLLAVTNLEKSDQYAP